MTYLRPGARRSGPGRRTRARRLASLAACALVVLGVALPQPANVAASDVDRQPLATLAGVTSATTSLLLTGHDPRYAGTAAWATWTDTPEIAPLEAPEAEQSAFRRNLLVSKTLGQAPISANPSLAVNPLDSDHLVLAASALDLPSVATYVSLDGGETWQGPTQAPHFLLDDGSTGSPSLAFDREGHLYLASLSFAGIEPLPGGHAAPARSRVTISRSVDGGRSWEDAVSGAVVARETATAADEPGVPRSTTTVRLLDWPSIVVSPDPRRPERDTIVVTYTELATTFASDGGPSGSVTESTIRQIRSADGGQSWSEPLAISPTATLSTLAPVAPMPADTMPGETGLAQSPVAAQAPPASSQVVQGAAIAALSNGDLLAAYFDSTGDGPHQGLARVMVARSEDGGRTFSEPIPAGFFREVRERPRTAFVRWWATGFPRLAIGPGDEVYIASSARPNARPTDDADVVLLRSLDQGATWQTPVTVNDDGTDASQFFPALAVTPEGDAVMAWGDTRDDASGVFYGIYTASSDDQVATWSGLEGGDASRVSDTLSNSLVGFPAGQFLGDRFAIAATPNDLHVAWADTRLASGGANNLQIAVAQQRPTAEP